MRLDAARRTATVRRWHQLDLGGIAKGYAADEALRVRAIAASGAALVAIGGDIVAGDPPPGLSAWTVAMPATLATPMPHWIA